MDGWLTVADLARKFDPPIQEHSVYIMKGRTMRRLKEGKLLRATHLPPPDDYAGQSPLWRESTIDDWLANRPSNFWKRDD